MVELFIKRIKTEIDAVAKYDVEKKEFVVKKGSKVNVHIAFSEKFRGAKSVEKARSNGVVEDGIVTRDVVFKSASTAANFVTGSSTNGLTAWKDKDGNTLKSILNK